MGIRHILPGILLLLCAWTDIKRREVSVILLTLFGVLGIGCFFLGRGLSVWQLLSGVLVGLLMVALSVLTRGGVGMGDGMLLVVVGIFIGGFRNMQILSGAVFMAALFSIVVFFLKGVRRNNLKSGFPFVPFLFLSYLCVFTL